MFRPMRRKKQELSLDEAKKILLNCNTGTLALLGDGGYPYSVPINYYFDGESKIYFHCAKQGHKTDAINKEERVSMSVIAKDEIYQQKFTTLYESVIIFGKAKIIYEQTLINRICKQLTEKLCPDKTALEIEKEINTYGSNMYIVEITAEHITGKRCIELINQ